MDYDNLDQIHVWNRLKKLFISMSAVTGHFQTF